MVNSETIKEIEEAKEKDNLKLIEAVLFVSGKYLNMQEIIALTDLNPIIIKELLEKIREKYNKEDSALEIIERNNLWKMDVKADYSFISERIATGKSEFTSAEKETLAIIAYKQPIKQSVLIKIRGNKAYDHIKKFIDLGLITKKKLGHTHELKISEEFYNYFNLEKGKKILEES